MLSVCACVRAVLLIHLARRATVQSSNAVALTAMPMPVSKPPVVVSIAAAVVVIIIVVVVVVVVVCKPVDSTRSQTRTQKITESHRRQR